MATPHRLEVTECGPAHRADLDPPLSRAAYSIKDFCAAHGISQAMYFKLRGQGRGPVEMLVGSRRFISFERAADWRRAREARNTAAGRSE